MKNDYKLISEALVQVFDLKEAKQTHALIDSDNKVVATSSDPRDLKMSKPSIEKKFGKLTHVPLKTKHNIGDVFKDKISEESLDESKQEAEKFKKEAQKYHEHNPEHSKNMFKYHDAMAQYHDEQHDKHLNKDNDKARKHILASQDHDEKAKKYANFKSIKEESLDEVSKGLIGRYIKKTRKDIHNKDYQDDDHGFRKVKNRSIGHERALYKRDGQAKVPAK